MSESVTATGLAMTLVTNPTAMVAGMHDVAWTYTPRLLGFILLGFAIHGFILGGARATRQTLSATVKAPLVPILSLLITLPLLHALALTVSGGGSFAATLTLALVPLSIAAILLASAAPLLLFFGLTSDYHFTKLLHVGTTGLIALWGAINLLRVLRGMGDSSATVFLAWIAVFFFVAAQMAWTLRPFIGAPDKPFRWIATEKDGLNFYTAVAQSLGEVLSKRTNKTTVDAVINAN